MKLKVLKDTVCDRARVKAGQVIDASDSEARTLLRYGKAEVWTEPKPRRTRKRVDGE